MRTKQQAQQEKRLSDNIRLAKSDRAEKAGPEKGRDNTLIGKLLAFIGSLLAAIFTRLFGRADRPRTVQQTIPYKQMYRDGVCRVSDWVYSNGRNLLKQAAAPKTILLRPLLTSATARLFAWEPPWAPPALSRS